MLKQKKKLETTQKSNMGMVKYVSEILWGRLNNNQSFCNDMEKSLLYDDTENINCKVTAMLSL